MDIFFFWNKDVVDDDDKRNTLLFHGSKIGLVLLNSLLLFTMDFSSIGCELYFSQSIIDWRQPHEYWFQQQQQQLGKMVKREENCVGRKILFRVFWVFFKLIIIIIIHWIFFFQQWLDFDFLLSIDNGSFYLRAYVCSVMAKNESNFGLIILLLLFPIFFCLIRIILIPDHIWSREKNSANWIFIFGRHSFFYSYSVVDQIYISFSKFSFIILSIVLFIVEFFFTNLSLLHSSYNNVIDFLWFFF